MVSKNRSRTGEEEKIMKKNITLALAAVLAAASLAACGSSSTPEATTAAATTAAATAWAAARDSMTACSLTPPPLRLAWRMIFRLLMRLRRTSMMFPLTSSSRTALSIAVANNSNLANFLNSGVKNCVKVWPLIFFFVIL